MNVAASISVKELTATELRVFCAILEQPVYWQVQSDLPLLYGLPVEPSAWAKMLGRPAAPDRAAKQRWWDKLW